MGGAQARCRATGESEIARAPSDRRLPVSRPPPAFLARVPYGYNDENMIRRALAGAGFGSVSAGRVALYTPADSAADAATGLCMGSPPRTEIEARAPERLDAVVQDVASALSRAFGEGPIVGHGQALVVTAIAIA